MKLSMSMIAWYLRGYQPMCHIQDDEAGIEGLRFVAEDAEVYLPEYVYFGEARTFFGADQYQGAYLAVNRHSMLLFPNSDNNSLLNGLLSAFEFFNRLEGRLLNAASCHAPLKTFLQIMEPVLENPFLLSNAELSFVVKANMEGHQTDPIWSMEMSLDHPSLFAPYLDTQGNRIREITAEPKIVKNIYAGGAPVVMLSLFKDGEYAGGLAILQEHEELLLQNMQLAPIFARYCVQAAEFVSATGALQAGASIFRNLLDGKEVGSLNLQKLESLLPGPPWRLLQIRMPERTDSIARNGLQRILRNRPQLFLCVIHREQQYAVISEAVFQSCLQGQQDTLKLPNAGIGASMPFSALSSLPVRRYQTEFALDQSGGATGIFPCERFAVDYLLGTIRGQETTASLLHPALETLKAYDKANQGELLETLRVYLRKERNQLYSAQALHIHPNTLRYRLQRIQQVTGLTLEAEEELQYLRLSLWLEAEPDT